MEKQQFIDRLQEQLTNWELPEIDPQMKQGDMPGDRIQIVPAHIEKAALIFPRLVQLMLEQLTTSDSNKVVISVSGGSGVGKTGVAALFTYFLEKMGIGSYTLSGDNYPKRIPVYNDAERLKIFREQGILQMLADDVYSPEHAQQLLQFQNNDTEADWAMVAEYPWMSSYIQGGINGLVDYLGTENEINFAQLSNVIAQFKAGESSIWLKRMGRTETSLYFDKMDFSNINVLIIEWTHGSNEALKGIDIPIFLNSTPAETLENRLARNRDGKIDSPFTTRVLEIEQDKLTRQAANAKLIVSNQCEFIDYATVLSAVEDSK
ncbi:MULTISPECIES: adenylylsulfate kinase [unclassified Facklamia]|uniref:adenylylsulfate kinase n=1 Tax=Aerococcaceae TaxID=186827 RepID=UPI0013BB262F|nr:MULTISPECIES: adenylylsulfate kinase [unclassified Facklamia]NEW64627.1 adenylylsulfate kinase [Facklamia sp. 252]NEW67952.1 adenylylsulfate kinase [Facklamia sp. 253]QQD65440.1 hypothetical protein JDW14_09230 [Aerococcaceae bacterium zg-252]